MNTDGALDAEHGGAGAGLMARNYEGVFVAARLR